MLKQCLDVINFLGIEYGTHLYNVKPSNIFLTDFGVWKFADYGY